VADNVALVSAEEIGLIDVDRLFWTSDPDLLNQLRDDPLYNRLNVVQDGRVSYLDYTPAPVPGSGGDVQLGAEHPLCDGPGGAGA
jgi:iron complex transport system substrate-binding protein